MAAMKRTREKSDIIAYPPDFVTIENLRDKWEEATALHEIEEARVYSAPEVFYTIKDAIKGYGEQMVFPDDCGFGDNDLCYVES